MTIWRRLYGGADVDLMAYLLGTAGFESNEFRTRRESIDGLPARTTDRYIAGDPGTVPD